MNNNYINLNEYRKTKLNLNKDYYSFFFIIIASIVLFYILICIKVDDYYINECIVKEDLLICNVLYNDIDYITNNNYLYINDKKYKYEIYSIEEDINNQNNIYYKEINLNINLENYNIDNNILEIKIKIYHDNLLNYMKRKIGGKDENNK